MLNVYSEINTLDKKCYEKYFLSEDILMEHASLAIHDYICQNFTLKSSILIVCGSGNNGADGLVLARQLFKKFNVSLYIASKIKKTMPLLQKQRTLSLGLEELSSIKQITKTNIVVDCLFGTGLNRVLDEHSQNLIKHMNSINAYKISCDIPSGLNQKGQILGTAFIANTTITMGAYKKSLFSDSAKDYVGDIICANLGIHESLYENISSCFLLQKSDLILPKRKQKNTNKGNFGHLAILLGNKKGAGIISCQTALNFGVGLVTAITSQTNLPYSIMYSNSLSTNTSAIAMGMGLGEHFDESILFNDLPLLLDADIFYNEKILKVLHKKNIVLTPHPKEFCSLLKLCSIATINVKTLQNDRYKYLNDFCTKYPNIVILLKGANVLIQHDKKLFINSFGTSALSFGGSGDVLAGLIASLLAQGYDRLDACITGSLVHTIAALNYKGNDYSLSVDDLINEIKIL